MSSWPRVQQLVLWFLPDELRHGEADRVRLAKLCVLYNLTIPLWAPGFAVLLWTLGYPAIAAVIGVGAVFAMVPLFVFRRTGSLAVLGNMMALEGTVLVVSCAWLEGGLGAPGVLWFPLIPIVAMLVAGRTAGLAWTGLTVTALTVFYALDRQGIRVVFSPGEGALALLRFALASSGVVVFLGLAALFESLKADALRSLENANLALARARDDAQAGTRAKSDFLATMSHELRTPLHGIFGMTELALDTEDDRERREFIERARACSVTLLAIIDDILDFSRIEAGKLVLDHVPFDPRAVMDGVLDTLAIASGNKGIELVGCVEDDLPALVVGDPGRLRQILVNLAGNAVKFTERGEVVIHLAAAPDPLAPTALLIRGSVRDTGIGIPHDKQAAVFEAFTQADSSTTSRFGGTGLGLAITRRLVALMDGTLGLESEPGRGSTFAFTIRMGSTAEAARPAPTVPAALRALVVDDNEAGRHHLLHTLRALGFEAAGATDADDAVAFVLGDAVPLDLVLIDLGMPEGDTARVLGILHARYATSPAVIGLAVPRHRAARPEMDAIVTKPIKSAPLNAALAAAQIARATRLVGARVGRSASSTAADGRSTRIR